MKIKYHTDVTTDKKTKKIQHKKRPKIEIQIITKNKPDSKFFALVDSGADICFMSRTICDSLEIDLTDAEKTTSGGIGGSITTYKVQIDFSIVYRKQLVPIGLTWFSIPEKDKSQECTSTILLGRDPFFKKYDVSFDENKKLIILKKASNK